MTVQKSTSVVAVYMYTVRVLSKTPVNVAAGPWLSPGRLGLLPSPPTLSTFLKRVLY